MRYQKNFVQNRVRVLGSILNKISLSHQKHIIGQHIIGQHIIHKKDGAQKVHKNKYMVYL
jgi:hypothetical protein